MALSHDNCCPRDHLVLCLFLDNTRADLRETSLAENFHRLAMNPADEAQAFAALVASNEDIQACESRRQALNESQETRWTTN